MRQRFQALHPIHVSLAVVALSLAFHVLSFFVPRMPGAVMLLLLCLVASLMKTHDLLATGFIKKGTRLATLTPLWLNVFHLASVAYMVANFLITYLLRHDGIDVTLHIATGLVLPWGIHTLMIAIAAERRGVFVDGRSGREDQANAATGQREVEVADTI